MNKKNLLSGRERELQEMAERYEKAKLNQQSIYLDAEDLADLADWYSVRQKRDMAHEVASYGLTLHPENISLLIEQAYLYLDDNNLEAAQQIANQLELFSFFIGNLDIKLFFDSHNDFNCVQRIGADHRGTPERNPAESAVRDCQ